jgi:hypothetical protein
MPTPIRKYCGLVCASAKDADRHPERRAEHEWCDFSPLQRMPQLPDRIALHHKSKAGDQDRRLQRRENVEPHRRGNDAEGEAANARDQGGEERPGEEDYREDVETEARIHGARSQS